MTGTAESAWSQRGVPLATYRLQFNRDFTLESARRLVPYLSALGISHVYASPYLKARAGSAHGYDITDHNALDPEIGDRAALDALVEALHRQGMGQILDFVPNHMGIAQADNAWWLDVLEWGRASPFADFFDIDWAPAKLELRGKVLLPFLGDHYGRVLESGELRLAFDREAGSFSVWYHEHRFPIGPPHYWRILGLRLAELRERAGSQSPEVEALGHLIAESRQLRRLIGSARGRAVMRRQGEALKAALAELAGRSPEVAAFIEATVERYNDGGTGQPAGFLALHRLLEAQSYRLAYWRVAADEINYRRFFDINDLAGLKIELPALFDTVHGLVFELIAEGKLDGLRIDHIDGLFDPADYCGRLQARACALYPGCPDGRFYIVVEKILARHERLREDWPIAGTTGYEFANLVGRLFVDPAGERALDRTYRRFSGRGDDFDAVLYASKKHVMDTLLAAELRVLANELNRLSEANWATRDFTLLGLRDALKEVVACFPVYRTYVSGRGIHADDRRDLDWALAQARKRSTTGDPSIFDFIHAVLTTDIVRRPGSGYNRRQVVRLAMKFQQYTGPVMAKALEDTSFYRYPRLLALNEVGGDPRLFAVSPAALHHHNQERAQRWPHALLATATHDNKRGEDVRARLAALSELAQDWGVRVRRWAVLNRGKRLRLGERVVPSANDEYLLYQTMLGAWPAELTDVAELDPEAVAALSSRVAAYMVKAVREAKLESSWASPDAAYEEGLTGFVGRILEVWSRNPFLDDFLPFQARVARLGLLNSLAQTTIKLTAPGVPDLYQGSELWDLNLVDPDNRRPVDYERRQGLLQDLQAAFGPQAAGARDGLAALFEPWQDGRVKLFLVWALLSLRKVQPEPFRRGAYLPLASAGARADHLCAFVREADGRRILVAVPRLCSRLLDTDELLPRGEGAWGDTRIVLDPPAGAQRYRNVLTGEELAAREQDGQAGLSAVELFEHFPVAVLTAA